ncbi:hypothetical protein [Neptunomonas japonica]|uniref:Uncharacterized protein n=1 Tax=Neptunomonas japonica JAMM 1380 TaxID=1441457 RepID=A0A7R6PAG1_9GAMM|nr:hypothetical protein [Neptunomonas japonica]BBB30213.1 conserved hypothetical protein [Neptunomonas japonica JAMM 1380]
MSKDIYQTFIGVKGVAFAWLGAAFGPLFIAIGLEPEYRTHLVVGCVGILIALACMLDGFRAFKANSKSGFLAFTVTPVILLLAGSTYSFIVSGTN